MDEMTKARLIVEAMQNSNWWGRAINLEPGGEFSMGALPEDANQRIVGAATTALNQIRQASGRSGHVTITTNGRVTKVKATW